MSGDQIFNDCTHSHRMIAVIFGRKKHPSDIKTFHRVGSGRVDARTECSKNSELWVHRVILAKVTS